MPTNKNAFLRFKILDQLLSDSVVHHYTMSRFTELCNEKLREYGMNVSRRCLEKDLEFLQNEFGNIKRVRSGKNTIISYIDQADSIFNQKISSSERKLLQSIVRILGKMDGLESFEFLKKLFRRETLNENVIISFESNQDLEQRELLPELLDFIENKQSIKFDYRSIDGVKTGNVELLPLLLKQYNGRWFLFGNTDTGKLLCFSLEQIRKIERSRKSINPKEMNWSEYFGDMIGVSRKDSDKVQKILFWISRKQAAYIRGKPLHSTQKELKRSAKELRGQYNLPMEGAFFEIECIVNYELKRELSSKFGELLVLEPESLRNEIARSVQVMVLRYTSMLHEVDAKCISDYKVSVAFNDGCR